MLSSCPFVRTIAAIGLAVLAASVGPVFAQAPESTVLPTAKRLYVVAEDKEVIVEASLPASCAGTTVTVAMFQRGGGAAVASIRVNLDPRAQRGFKIVMMNGPGNPGFGLDETNSPFTVDERRSGLSRPASGASASFGTSRISSSATRFSRRLAGSP